MKILFCLLLGYSWAHNTYDDYPVFQELIKNVVDGFDSSQLFEDFNIYFNKIYYEFKNQKVSGMTSYNMKTIGNIFLKSNKFYNQWDNLGQVKFKDKFNLYYVMGVDGFKYQNLIIFSQKKHKFLTIIHEKLGNFIEENFNKEGVKVHNKSIKIINITKQRNVNPQINNIYVNYLGGDSCHITITPMEVFVLKKSFEDDFYKKYDGNLKRLDLYLYIDKKSDELFQSDQFAQLKKFILENFLLKKIIKYKNEYGEKVHHYIFDIHGKDLSNTIKKKFIKYFLYRDILLTAYDYLY